MAGIYWGSDESASQFLFRARFMKPPRRIADQQLFEISLKLARESLAKKGIHEVGIPSHPFAEELAAGALKPHDWVDDAPATP